jgi:NAD(P)H-dependent FMN reductase
VFSGKDKTPESFWELDKRMTEANGFIMVSPEYNGSYTAALKNLFDHFPRQTHKPFGVATTSLGALGGIRASQQMQLLINGLFGIGSPFMLITPFADKKFDVDGSLVDIAFQSKIDLFVNEYLWLAERLMMTNM